MATSSTPYAMAQTPKFQELKKAADSNNLEDIFRFLFSQEYTGNEGFIMLLGKMRDDLVEKIKGLEKLIEEGEGFCPFHDEGDTGLEFMKQTLERDKKVLAALTGVIDLACERREEKKFHLFWFGLRMFHHSSFFGLLEGAASSFCSEKSILRAEVFLGPYLPFDTSDKVVLCSGGVAGIL
ncbi:hypothetical protein CTI12_AA325900 [Artemisia annua]|uniref:Uncharacterized protein n=1 Tax=Artemisia annua TaxID=35608 RepID=A0A2U1MZD4_ARTAN|nr:hypothetical protein CTI12_AA325900 [Artemisia annua]